VQGFIDPCRNDETLRPLSPGVWMARTPRVGNFKLLPTGLLKLGLVLAGVGAVLRHIAGGNNAFSLSVTCISVLILTFSH